jgi:hypothetical protein
MQVASVVFLSSVLVIAVLAVISTLLLGRISNLLGQILSLVRAKVVGDYRSDAHVDANLAQAAAKEIKNNERVAGRGWSRPVVLDDEHERRVEERLGIE